MSAPFVPIGSVNYNATAVNNETINLNTFEVEGVPAGQVAGGAGIVPPVPTGTSSSRGLMIIADNRTGSADAYLATAAQIAAHDPIASNATPLGGLVIPAGQRETYGDFYWTDKGIVDSNGNAIFIRSIVGAELHVSVVFTGYGG